MNPAGLACEVPGFSGLRASKGLIRSDRDPEVKQLKEALRKKDRVLRRVAGTLHRVAARLVASTEKERKQQAKRSQPDSQLSLASVMRDKEDMWARDAAIAAACPPAMAMEAYRIARAQRSAPTPSTYILKGKRTKESKKQAKQTADTKIRQSVPTKKITAKQITRVMNKSKDPNYKNSGIGSEDAAAAWYASKQHPAQAVMTPGQVVSVWGATPSKEDRYTPFFSQKSICFDGDFSRMRHRVGVMSHRGHKPESPNQ
ncbi:unnamed protein product, partial [Prorocentrum cordatum]